MWIWDPGQINCCGWNAFEQFLLSHPIELFTTQETQKSENPKKTFAVKLWSWFVLAEARIRSKCVSWTGGLVGKVILHLMGPGSWVVLVLRERENKWKPKDPRFAPRSGQYLKNAIRGHFRQSDSIFQPKNCNFCRFLSRFVSFQVRNTCEQQKDVTEIK